MTSTETRHLAIELDGILRHVPGHYHQSGPLVGRMITAAWFQAECPYFGPSPVPVPMALHRPRTSTDPRLIVIDNTASPWVLSFRAWHDARPYKITGFHTDIAHDAKARVRPGTRRTA
ncbi:hypothetical protein [Streptomyces sp. NPDC059819]|uniref:hypothetical protein n=1 Tax=Streptomyces sp. NPDC059819 TaxID=3346963 RepID=UPI00364DF433